VKDPSSTVSSEFTPEGKVISLEEKPQRPKSALRRARVVLYDNQVISIAKNLSRRRAASSRSRTSTARTSTPGRSPSRCSGAVRVARYRISRCDAAGEQLHPDRRARQGLKIGCLEEIAFRKGFLDLDGLRAAGTALEKTEYGQYLLQLARELG